MVLSSPGRGVVLMLTGLLPPLTLPGPPNGFCFAYASRSSIIASFIGVLLARHRC